MWRGLTFRSKFWMRIEVAQNVMDFARSLAAAPQPAIAKCSGNRNVKRATFAPWKGSWRDFFAQNNFIAAPGYALTLTRAPGRLHV